MNAHVQLRAVDRRDGPLDGVPGPHERAGGVATRGLGRPRHLELHDGRVRALLDDGVEHRAVRHHLHELSVRDLELRGLVRVAEDRVRRGVDDLRAQVLVEVGVLLWAQREREGYKRGRNGLPQRG